MRVSAFAALLVGSLMAATRVLACANGDVQELPDASVGPDSGATPVPDGSTPIVTDAGHDADSSADDADASETLPCSPDGFCHTTLPGPTPSADGGIPSGVTRDLDLRDVWLADDGDAFSISASGDLIGWHDERWTVLLETDLPLQHLWARNKDDLWIAASAGRIVHVTRDGAGAYQTRVESTGSTDAVDELFGHGEHIWIVTSSGKLLLRDASTGSWHDDPFPIEVQGSGRIGRIEAIWRNGNEVWARGSQYDDTVFFQNLLLQWSPRTNADVGASDASDEDAGDATVTDWKVVPLVATPYVWQGTIATSADTSTALLCASFNCDKVARALRQDGGWTSEDEATGRRGEARRPACGRAPPPTCG